MPNSLPQSPPSFGGAGADGAEVLPTMAAHLTA